MSTAGGAAGLTLTVATTAFLLEPSLNPGLEAQAAARIYRLGGCTKGLLGGSSIIGCRLAAGSHPCINPRPLRCHPPCAGQDKPTRVIRLLAEDSVEKQARVLLLLLPCPALPCPALPCPALPCM